LNKLIAEKEYKTIKEITTSIPKGPNVPKAWRTTRMTETEKLQKAVGLTIAAGYQLNKEAFEFLNIVAATEDPTKIMNQAIKRIEDLSEKPLFIERSFLEQLLKETEPQKEIIAPEEHTTELPQSQMPQITEAKAPFHPYAKEIDANINVIEDPSTKLNTSGTIEDFLEYFRDRFRRMEKLLRQRMDVKSAASITDALRAQANTKLKIIGMITEKRESKGRTVLTVEDLQANITVLVPQNAPEDLQKRARLLLLDQVVCLSVRKTRTTLLIAEDIILPEIGQKPQRKASVPVYTVLTSDMHVGSTKFQREAFNRFILWLNGKYGNNQMREMASHVKYVVIAGDIVDGVGIYPNQVKELAIRDIHKQYRLAAKYIEQIPDYIEVIITPGNHDAPRKALPQPAISNTYLETLRESRNVYSLGNPCTISLHGVETLVYHGRSLDDIISTVPEMSHNNPERAMRLLLQSRHLAPIYGGKTTLSPENRDFLVIEQVPDIFHAGHIHALGYTNYRGVLVVNSGGWQDQTEYMQKLGFVPTPGKVPVINLQTLEVNIASFN
jgi:DNA polymerase II small subunit